MDKKTELLKELGLENRETKVYLAALEYGPTTIANLAYKSGIKRTSIYEFLPKMIEGGFVLPVVIKKRRLYEAAKTKDLEKIIERKRQIIKELEPELDAIIGGDIKKYKVMVYEGTEGATVLYQDSLNLPKGSEILSYSSFYKAKNLPSKYL